jgi:hypothetical protein
LTHGERAPLQSPYSSKKGARLLSSPDVSKDQF